MYEERGWSSLIINLLRGFAYVFTSAILAMLVVGKILTHFFPDGVANNAENPLFIINSETAGLSFNTILQFSLLSFIMAVVIMLLFSEHFFPKMRYLLRIFLLSLVASLVIFIFSIIFRWFPFEERWAWLGFAFGILTCFGFTFLFSFIGYKLEGKKYNRLLANYKARRKKEP